MTPLLSMGETLSVNASLFPDKIGARDLPERCPSASGMSALAGWPTHCSGLAWRKAIVLRCWPTIASSGWKSKPRPRRLALLPCRSTSAC